MVFIIHSPDARRHLIHLRAVRDRLRKHQFYCKISKCSFATEEVKFLGHILSSRGLHDDPDKLAFVDNWPLLNTVSHVRSFLGLCNYFGALFRVMLNL